MVASSKEPAPAIPTTVLLPDGSQSLTLHAFDWRVKPGEHDSIHCWGLDRNSQPLLIRYNDFPTFCWIELPEKVDGRPYHWDAEGAHLFMQQLSRSLNYNDNNHAQ